MKKQVLTTTCDNCGSEERVDFADANAEFTLPKNWMNVVGRRNGGEVFELDLCPECTMMVLAAGGRMPPSIKAKPITDDEQDLKDAVEKLKEKWNAN